MGGAQSRPCDTRAAPGPSLSGPERALRVRWRFRLRGQVGFSGVFASTPVVSGDRVYIQDLNSNVFALSLADGRRLWTHRFDRPDGGPNGVTVADGKVVGNTDTTAFALDAAQRERALAAAADELAQNPITIAPTVANGTGLHELDRAGPGRTRRGLRTRSDDRPVKWRFDTIAEPWRFPQEAARRRRVVPAVGRRQGRVYVGPRTRTRGAARAGIRTAARTPAPRSTPTRSSSSTARPASSSGTTR